MPFKKNALIVTTCLLTLLFGVKVNEAEAKAWPGDTIGAGFGVALKPERATPDDFKRIKAAGFSFVRFDMRWDQVEKSRGEYDWTDLDEFIGRLRENHLKSFIILDDTNGVYTEKVKMLPQESWGQGWAYASPTDETAVNAFVDFTVAAVKRYGEEDIIWEMWNEPDMPGSWSPKPDAEAYSYLAAKTCTAMRTVAPHAVIVGPAIARLPNMFDFLHAGFFRTFIQSSAVPCFDAISVHPYRTEPPETVIKDYDNKVRPFIATYTPKGRKPLPVMDSEWGYTSTEVSVDQQTAYALRMHLSNLLAGVPLSILYEWKDTPHIQEEREMHFGLVDSEGQNKAGADAIIKILPRIKDAVIVRRLAVEDSDCFVLLIRQPRGHYQLLTWMGVRRLTHSISLDVKSNAAPTHSYPLSLMPQLIDIDSPSPLVSMG